MISTRWQHANAAIDGLSEHYSEIVIGHDRELIELHEYTTEDLMEFLKAMETTFRLQKSTNSNYSWVYMQNMNIGLEIVSGRDFNEEDFILHRNVALVSEDMKKDACVRDGVEYIDINGNEYEIIGTFIKEENAINPNTDVFLNMYSENYIYLENNIEGTYFIDTGKDNTLLCEALDTWCYIRDKGSIFEKSVKEKYQLVKDALVIPINILYLVIAFMGLGISYITCFWMFSMKKEIFIHRLCGANSKSIIRKNLRIYSKYVLIAFISVLFLIIQFIEVDDIIKVYFIVYVIGFIHTWILSNRLAKLDMQRLK